MISPNSSLYCSSPRPPSTRISSLAIISFSNWNYNQLLLVINIVITLSYTRKYLAYSRISNLISLHGYSTFRCQLVKRRYSIPLNEI
jgi:hypothetical protein